MVSKEEILTKIAAGCNNSRKLADALPYSQEHIRRVVRQLEQENQIIITREPRGNTYTIAGTSGRVVDVARVIELEPPQEAP